ncbi:hypothetical protein GGX14DRAFT_481345 [Mycena pura]|uniref:Uncharacterized protein n=1 Tax=Mycena pura TaxID=153505 RepID=A0AAD6UPD3_9AGAR|nr:hypothetical protein GGX14DRAFT_481345 [Mycena pura]
MNPVSRFSFLCTTLLLEVDAFQRVYTMGTMLFRPFLVAHSAAALLALDEGCTLSSRTVDARTSKINAFNADGEHRVLQYMRLERGCNGGTEREQGAHEKTPVATLVSTKYEAKMEMTSAEEEAVLDDSAITEEQRHSEAAVVHEPPEPVVCGADWSLLRGSGEGILQDI